jgi:hypothetical protein
LGKFLQFGGIFYSFGELSTVWGNFLQFREFSTVLGKFLQFGESFYSFGEFSTVLGKFLQFWEIFCKHLQGGIKEEEKSVHFIRVGGPSEPRKGEEGPLPSRLIGETLTCKKTQSFRDVQLFQLLLNVGTIYRSTLESFRKKKVWKGIKTSTEFTCNM